jgi:hypothetical protein
MDNVAKTIGWTVFGLIAVFALSVTGSYMGSSLNNVGTKLQNQDTAIRASRLGGLIELSNSYCSPVMLQSDRDRIKGEIGKITIKDKTLVGELPLSSRMVIEKIESNSIVCTK